MKSYVINTSNEIEQLLSFFKQNNVEHFEGVLLDNILEKYIDKIFDKEKFYQINKYIIRNENVINTIAHFECWKKIAKNPNINDREFVLICADSIRFVDGWLPKLTSHINTFHKNSQYNLILLNSEINNVLMNNSNKELSSVVLFGSNVYDNSNCQCYLIRKSLCIKLLEKFKVLPYYNFNQFSKFCESSELCQLRELIAVVDKSKQKVNTVSNETLKKPLFSIIISVYNIDGYLERAIESVLSQTNNNFEIILINDGSTDFSAKICNEYHRRYSNISVLHLNINQGQGNARNMGIKVAKGKYLVFLDGDDYWVNNNFLFELSNRLNNKPDIIFLNSNANHRFRYNNIMFITDKVINRNVIIENKIKFSNDFVYEMVQFNIKLFGCIRNYECFNFEFDSKTEREGNLSYFYNRKTVKSLLNNYKACENEISKLDCDSAESDKLKYLSLWLFVTAARFFYEFEEVNTNDEEYNLLNKKFSTIPNLIKDISIKEYDNQYFFNLDILKGKSVAIIGAADTAFIEKNGKYIDSFDIVIRINHGYLSIENNEEYLGTKTNILINGLHTGGFENEKAYADFNKWKEMRIDKVVFPNILLNDINRLHFIYQEEPEFPIWQILPTDILNLYKELNYYSPTNGLTAIYLASLAECSKLYITGFTFYRTNYYDGYSLGEESKSIIENSKKLGFHDVDAEYEWFKNFYQNNKDRVEIDKGMQAIFDVPNQ